MVVRHGYPLLLWDDRYEPYLRQCGFYDIQQIGVLKWDDALVCVLVERWRSETHTFHLPIGEMTIILQDVSILLGLSIHDLPIRGVTDLLWESVVAEYLGVDPEGKAMANKSALSLT